MVTLRMNLHNKLRAMSKKGREEFFNEIVADLKRLEQCRDFDTSPAKQVLHFHLFESRAAVRDTLIDDFLQRIEYLRRHSFEPGNQTCNHIKDCEKEIESLKKLPTAYVKPGKLTKVA